MRRLVSTAAAISLALAMTACREPRPDRKPDPAPDAAVASGGVDACVGACLLARQMEARGIEAITADCKRECAQDPSAYRPQ